MRSRPLCAPFAVLARLLSCCCWMAGGSRSCRKDKLNSHKPYRNCNHCKQEQYARVGWYSASQETDVTDSAFN